MKKIKRTHGAENPTKNYYLAFPALSSKKTTTTITSGGRKLSPGEVGETIKDSKLQLLCWSNLMSSAKENSRATSSSAVDAENCHAVVKLKKRRQRRYGKTWKHIDVQCNDAKSYDGTTFPPKAKNVSKKHQRNQYGKCLHHQQPLKSSHFLCFLSTVTSKNPKSFVVARNNNFSNAEEAPKMDFPTGSAPMWDMDFKGQWEMDRDLISEFIQQQHHPKVIKTLTIEAKSTNQVEQAMDEQDDAMMMKYLPMKLMDDDATSVDEEELKEAQTISSLKSKFDANVKALWNDVDDTLAKPLTHKSFEDSNASLVSSFASENNSLSLFNFSGRQPHQTEVIAPCTNLQFYNNADFMSIADFDNTRNSGRGAGFNSHHSSASTISPGAEKFIKSGTNLQSSIWSDGEFACEAASLIYKDVSITSHKGINASRS